MVMMSVLLSGRHSFSICLCIILTKTN